MAGAYYVPGGNGLVEARMHLYRNDTALANVGPAAPATADVFATESAATFSWAAALDDSTPAASLTYDLELRSVSAFNPSTPLTPTGGARRLPEPGGVSAATILTVGGLAPGDYVWSVRGVDSAFNGGALAGGTFSIPGPGIFADSFESGDARRWTPPQP